MFTSQGLARRRAVFRRSGDGWTRDVEIEGHPDRFPLIDVFPSGDLLVVNARARRKEKNARIFTPEGALLRQFAVGDAVEHAFVDDLSRIWVGHFDENPKGVVCFDRGGAKLWDSITAGLDLFDVYAMNVYGKTMCAYAYTRFDIVEVDSDFTTQTTRTEIEGARALAKQGDTCLLTGGYHDDGMIGYLGRVRDGRLVSERVRFETTDGVTFDSSGGFVGRGWFLHHVGATGWHVADVRDLT
jgi:hypothetical protein